MGSEINGWKENSSSSSSSKFVCFLFGLSMIFSHCSSSKKIYTETSAIPERIIKPVEVKRTLPLKTTDSLNYLLEHNHILKNHFVGFSLYDLENKENILRVNASRPFTPASNMKLFTLYAALSYLDDRVTALEYRETDDSLIIRGVGDPSFLDPYQKDNDFAFDFLSQSDKDIYVDLSAYEDKRYGTGWAWDDYPYYYQTEKSGLPIYANKYYIRKAVEDSLIHIEPNLFERHINYTTDTIAPSIKRSEFSNELVVNNFKLDKKLVNWDMPVANSNELLLELLSDTLNQKVKLVTSSQDSIKFKQLKGIATDSLLQELMIVSDNFIAEQLLLMCSQEELGYMKTNDLIKHAMQDILFDMPDTIRWVDGSGLSRYNLVTPNANIWVLENLLTKWDFEKIKTYFPSGKGNDTLDESFQYEKPWIFAKTGSLSNNFNLSGYLITKSNRILLFSFMNNHYLDKRSEVINEMNSILSFVRDNY